MPSADFCHEGAYAPRAPARSDDCLCMYWVCLKYIRYSTSCLFLLCVSIITPSCLVKIIRLDVGFSSVLCLTFHCLLLLPVVSGQNCNTTRMASNNRSEDDPQVEDENEPTSEPDQSVWRSIWQNNKGALLILSSVICGASMDAIARFLQQGGAGFHTLQVCSPLITMNLDNSGNIDTSTRSSRLVWV